MKKWVYIVVAVLGVSLALSAGVYAFYLSMDKDSTPAATPQASDAPDMGEAPHPLSRDAIAAKDYPGSGFTIEQDLGQTNGFHSYVVSYRSEGHKIRALLNVPNGQQPASGWPVIIFNHGYIPPKEYRTTGGDYQYWINGLTNAGYIVIKPDYRGHDQSEGPAVGGNYAPDYVTDVLNLKASLKNWQGADPNRVGMVGHSMGGAITMRAVTAKEDIKASAILAGVVGTAEDMYYNWRRTPPRPSPPPGMFGSGRQDMTNKYGDPRANPEFWNSVTPINFVRYITGPVQIHHSADDGEVPKEFSDHLNAALDAAGKPHQYYQYPGGGHQFTGTGGLVLQRMIELFKENIS